MIFISIDLCMDYVNRLYCNKWEKRRSCEECAAEFVRTLARGLRWVSRHLGRRLRCHLSRQLGVPGMFSRWHRSKRERCHLGGNYQLPDAVAPSDCRRLSANLRNFSQSTDLQLVPARRSSRAAGDSSAAVWVAALGQDCIDVLICSLDFLLFSYILD